MTIPAGGGRHGPAEDPQNQVSFLLKHDGRLVSPSSQRRSTRLRAGNLYAHLSPPTSPTVTAIRSSVTPSSKRLARQRDDGLIKRAFATRLMAASATRVPRQ